MAEVRVNSWIELQQALFENSWQDSIERHRSHFVFRGVPRAHLPLQTSLQSGHFVQHEKHLLTSFRKYALRSAVHGDWVWNWLSLAKHHGLPTRLLDWTYSPYVAMHFATHDIRHFDDDAAIWCVDYRKTNELLPDPLCHVLRDEEVNIFTTEMINRVATTLPQFDQLGKND
ncbi:MAG TPA: FRG domain-containing protein, partial [Thermoanaerobaculia bacterium]